MSKGGMTIDKATPKIQFVRNALNDDMEIAKAYDLAIDAMRKYQQMGMTIEEALTEVKLEIQDEGAHFSEVEGRNSDYVKGLSYALNVIQKKIDALVGGQANETAN
ncbi:MAG: hypothetical protein K6G10_01575 [Butyrivibrio sp.]|nr:hypothetical protein [Butyrivibrio sp.]